jgi:O-antigen ligase
MGPLFIPATLYVLVCIASTALNFQSAAVNALLQMILYLFAAVVVFSSTVKNPMDLYPSLNASLIVGAVLGVGALTTKYQFLHMHKNAWGAIMSTLTIIGVELWFAATTKKRKRLLMLSIVITGATLFFSVSRGAWLGACTGIFVIIMLRRQFKLALRLMLLLIPLVLVMWAIMPEQDRDYALGFEAERGNIAARYETIDYCRNLFLQHPILGVGVALRKQVDATNIIFVTLAETGVLGLGLFLALHGAFYRMAWRIQAGVARTHPVYSLFAVSTALITRCLTHGLVDHYWSRGPILQAWGAAGMAICAACYLRRTSALRASNSARTTPGRPIPQIPGLQPL